MSKHDDLKAITTISLVASTITKCQLDCEIASVLSRIMGTEQLVWIEKVTWQHHSPRAVAEPAQLHHANTGGDKRPAQHPGQHRTICIVSIRCLGLRTTARFCFIVHVHRRILATSFDYSIRIIGCNFLTECALLCTVPHVSYPNGSQRRRRRGRRFDSTIVRYRLNR